MIITAPEIPTNFYYNKRAVFLAGSIDNGASVDWQSSTTSKLDALFSDLVIYNPRRENWDTEPNRANLQAQICWELKYLKQADIVLFNFLEDSAAPISMLELGLTLAAHKPCVIINPPKFYRHDNILLTAFDYGKTTYPDYDSGFKKLISILDRSN